MHKITESFADKTIEVETENLFDTALTISDFVKTLKLGRLKTIDQSFRTDGPNDIVKLIFQVQKNFDKRTKSIIHFSIFGEHDKMSHRKGMLVVRVRGSMETTLSPQHGIVSSALDDYYLKSIYKMLISRTKDQYNRIFKAVKKEFA